MIYSIYITYFISFITRINGELIIENNHEITQKMADFTTEIIEEHCHDCKTVMIVHSGQELTFELFLDQMSNKITLYTIIVDGNGTAIPSLNDKDIIEYLPELTIFFINTDVLFIEAIIFSIELLPRWNIRGKFLVICEGENILQDDELETFLQESFDSFWERQVLRVLICFYIDNKIKMITFDPFKENYNIEIFKEHLNEQWFNRIVTNMYGTTIKLYQFDTVLAESAVKKVLPDGSVTWVGPDGMFFSVLAKSMNTSLEVHRISEDFDENLIRSADPSLPFSQYMNLFSEMFDFDLLFNRMQTFSDNYLDHIFLYERNEWRVIVPRAGLVPQYLYIVLLVQGEVWAATIISLLGIILLRKIIGGRFAAPVLDNLAYLLGTSAPHRNNMTTIEKILLALWALDCVVIATMFQTTLMSSLVVPKFFPNIDTLNEICQKNLQVYGPEYTNIQISRILVTEDDLRFKQQLRNVPRELTVYGDNIDWIDNYKHNSAVIITQEQLYRLKKLDHALFETNHIVAESPMPNAVSYNIRRNKLYYLETQRVFGTIQEAGLHQHWRNYDYFLDRTTTKNQTKIQSESEQVLTLVHLQSAFFLLQIGLFSSFVIFILEIFWFYTKKKHNIDFIL